MTMSDLEQTLAEARAAAARRLDALRRLEDGRAGQATAPEPVVARSRPVNASNVTAQPQTVAPDVVAVRTAALADAPEPFVPRAQQAIQRQPAPGDANDAYLAGIHAVGVKPVAAQPQRFDEGVDYVRADGVAHARLDPRAALGAQGAQLIHAEPQEGFSARVFAKRAMNALLAGVASFRENRARRRALATAEAQSVERVADPRPKKQRLTEKELRWERRRKRYLFEEILGWILVPTILVALYFVAVFALELFGTTPDALIEGIKTIWAQFS